MRSLPSILARRRMNMPEAEPVTEVNVIPIIDISLVLLVILFISAPLLSYPSLPIDLPKAFTPQTSETSVMITCTTRGELAVGMDSTDWSGLKSKVQEYLKRSPGATVVLRVDKTISYQTVEKLMAAAQEAGATKIALGTERPR